MYTRYVGVNIYIIEASFRICPFLFIDNIVLRPSPFILGQIYKLFNDFQRLYEWSEHV